MSLKYPELIAKVLEAQSKYNIFTSIRENPVSNLQSGILKNKTVAVKDNIVTKNEFTTCSSRVLQDYKSPFDATIVKLLENEGSVIVGKTNMDEFGMGSSTTNSIFGPTMNPAYPDEQRISGGSSGGSAAAVSAGLVDFSIGTDTGGSVRLPAAYNDIIGFKPSYGRISRWGVIAYAQSLDTVGIMSKDLSIVESVYNILNRFDKNDPTSLSIENRNKIIENDSQKLRIGIPVEFLIKNLSKEVLNSWKETLLKLQKDFEIIPVSIPNLKYSLPIYYTIAPAEASSNLARYDGIRYGYRSDEDKNHYSKTRSESFGKEVQNRILLGNYNLQSDSFKNNFLKAMNERNNLKSQFDSIFKFKNIFSKKDGNPDGVDIILTPTAISKPPTLSEFKKQTITDIYLNDTLTVPASLAGLPAISIPMNTHSSVQIIGQFGDDQTVFKASKLLLSV